MLGKGERFRFFSVVAGLAVAAVYVATRLILLHLDPDSVRTTAPRTLFEREVEPLRGSIVTAGRPPVRFAQSVPVWVYHVDPKGLNTKKHVRQDVARTVSDALGLDYADTLPKFFHDRSRYVFLARGFDPDAHAAVADSSRVSGVVIEEEQDRCYPQNRRLCHVLGYVSKDPTNRVGCAGIEMRYDRYLRGTAGRIVGERDAKGRELYDRRRVSTPAVPGCTVELTIDPNIQRVTEDCLAAGMRASRAKAAWAVVLRPRTGDVLAMASLPDYEPERYNDASSDARKNRCVSENYEPGSVMKTITACAVLNEKRVTADTLMDTRRDDPRYYKLPGDGSHKWEPKMTVRDALVHSSNIVYGKLGYDLGPEKLSSYMRAFGFGARTDVGLPAEETGIVPSWKSWDKASWSRAAIGQFVAVTPIQLAAAYGAIANDGMRVKPRIVSRVVSPTGETMLENAPEEVERVISRETARRVREMMLGVAKKGGTARRAAVKGYSVAGKTGTAQRRSGRGYSQTDYNASFIGMVPAMRPEIVVLVAYQSPEHCSSYRYHEETGLPLYNHQGGVCAAPVFSEIASFAMRYLEIEPDRPDEIPEEDD